MSIGMRIKEAREGKELTRAELATKVGVTPSAVSNYENGISSPKETVLYKLFEALGCDANFLFQDEMEELTIKKEPPTETMSIEDIFDLLKDFDAVWNELEPAEKKEITSQLLGEKILVSSCGI